MANFTLSPNMNLIIPIVGQEAGPQYATDINNSLTLVDQHDHSVGYGVQITPSGLNINSTLTLNNQQLTDVAVLGFQAQASNAVLRSIYVIGTDLYYNDGSSNIIQITSGGAVNATASGISNGTATASFSSGVLIVNAAANTPANIQVASVLLGNNIPNSKYVTLSPPNSMPSDYNLILPATPAQTNVMTLDSSGNMSSITYNAVGQNMSAVGANAIAITTTRTVGPTVGSNGIGVSGASGNQSTTGLIANLCQVTITVSGNRPVYIALSSPTNANVSYIGMNNSSGGTAFFDLFRGLSQLTRAAVASGTTSSLIPPNSISTIDTPSAGTYTYSLTMSAAALSSATANNIVLIAYEL